MFIFRKKRMSAGKFKMPVRNKNRTFHYFNKKNNAIKSNITPAIFIFILFSYVFFLSGFLNIKIIYIENNVNLKQDDIIKSAEEILARRFAGIVRLDNYFIVNESDIKSFLMDKYPMIETLEIKKESYNALTISIREKESHVIWCKLEDCYYLDDDSIAFANAKNELKLKNRPLKIYEQPLIEEEVGDKKIDEKIEATENADASSDSSLSMENTSFESKPIRDPGSEKTININTRIADSNFIRFLINIDKQIAAKTNLQIKYYKTKGARTREIIAYTDKNIRLYFDSSGDAVSQSDYLASFLNEGIVKDKIYSLKYIYLKSGNKIFYK